MPVGKREDTCTECGHYRYAHTPQCVGSECRCKDFKMDIEDHSRLIQAIIGPDKELYANNPVFHHGVKTLAKFTLEHRKIILDTARVYDEAFGPNAERFEKIRREAKYDPTGH